MVTRDNIHHHSPCDHRFQECLTVMVQRSKVNVLSMIIEVTKMKNLFNAILVAIRKEYFIVEFRKVVEKDA
jgi:hypothetical protein